MEKETAFLATGATHARELASIQMPLFICLKLLYHGIVKKQERYVNMLRKNKFYFIPIVDVDGAA